jgi:hypothetical protein
MGKVETRIIKRADLWPAVLVESLRSEVCPICGGRKGVRMTMCRADYKALPASIRSALYSGVGIGYEEAIGDVMTFFAIDALYLPADGNCGAAALRGEGGGADGS